MMVTYKLLYHCRVFPYSNYVVWFVALFPNFLPKAFVVMSIYVLIRVCPLLGWIFFAFGMNIMKHAFTKKLTQYLCEILSDVTAE